MKKLVSIIALLLFLAIHNTYLSVFAETSKYWNQIQQCLDAREPNGKWAKTIENFVCPVGSLSLQQIVFQVIMSIEFKKLDDEIKVKLSKIYAWSNKDIGQLATDIGVLFNETNPQSYPSKYKNICNTIVIKEANLYLQEKKTSLTTDNDAKNFVFWEKGCQTLVDRKLMAYKDAAWLLGESALVNSFKKDKHDYMRKLKDEYEKFLNKWTMYIGQLGVIKDKWTLRTETVL